jgi:FkbM family methyltransferase
MWKLLRLVWRHPLNAQGKLQALWRLFSWQVASRLMPGPIALPFVEGTRLFATQGMIAATGNWYCGLMEAEEMGFVLHVLQPGDHFLDVGANIGSFTILAAGATGARTSAVEPIPETFSHLQRNITLNELTDRVRAHRIGLSDKSSTLRFSSKLDVMNHVLADGEQEHGLEVPVMPMDELVGRDVPTLIKIDVEGHELAVLRGAAETLRHEQLLAVIMETNGSGARYGVSDDDLVAELRKYGFQPFEYDPYARRLTAASILRPNTVFVRNLATVEHRVRAAPRFQLVNQSI